MAVDATGTATNGLPYIGNADYRGYLNYLGSNGDTAANSLLSVVGNDGQFGEGGGAPLSNDVLGQNNQYYYNWLTGGSNNGGNTTSSTSATNTANDLAALGDNETHLRDMLGSADTNLNNGLTQLGDTFGKENSRLATSRATADAGFDTNRTDAETAKQQGIDTVNTGARTLANSVRQVLGLASGSNSSAFQQAAPMAIARDATGKRSGVIETAAHNLRNIDTSQQNTDLKFNQSAEDLAAQRKQKESDLRAGVLQNQQSIYGQLADIARKRAMLQGGTYAAGSAAAAPDTQAISDRQTALDNLFQQFRTPFTAKDVAVDTPTIDKATIDPTALAVNATDSSGYSPYSAFLRKKFAGA